MLSYVFLIFSAVHIGIWLWGWKLWNQNGRPVSLLIVLLGGTLLFYDNLRIGIGRFIGPGDLLHNLTVPAFAWHWAFLPLLIIAAGSLARLAGLRWAANKAVMGIFCLAAVALMAYDIPKIFSMELHTACLADTVRYTTSVSPSQLCDADDPVIAGGAEAALAAILTNFVVLLVGIALWIQRRWPWLAVGAGIMFIAAGGFARSPWALPISNFGEICFTLGFIVSCAHFARARMKMPDMHAAPMRA